MIRTPEEEVARREREKIPRNGEPEDGLTDFDRMISGHGGKHIVLPYPNDAHNMKRIGGLLQGFGADLVNLSNRHELNQRSKILEWRYLVDQLNKRVREMTGKGRRDMIDGAESGEGITAIDRDIHSWHEIGTEETGEFWRNLEIVTGKKFDGEHRENTYFSCSC